MPHTLFISDLHLCPTRPRILSQFHRFLNDVAPQAEALYILGDFFEYWAGDDDLDDPMHQAVCHGLRTLAAHGTHVYVMHGNRDFLLADGFMQAAQATLLADPTRIDLYGTPTLLMHGDTLCTDDVAYLQFRAQVRSSHWQTEFLAKPLSARKAVIDGLRKQSEQAKSVKPADIMDVNTQAVETTLRAYQTPRLIHGHTHRPGRHEYRLDGMLFERWVLPDWYEHGGYLRCDPQGCSTHNLTETP